MTRRHPAVTPALTALVAAAISFAGSWIPSMWYDEGATASAATRSLTDLGRMVQAKDLVHTVFYALEHGLVQLLGNSPVVLRLPSALAVGLAAALLVLLVRRLLPGDERLAVLAGITFAVLPRVTWAGTEARSYAMTALLAVATTLVLVVASGQRRRRWWVLYTVVAAFSIVVWVYLALVVLAHGVALARSRGLRLRWVVGAASAVLVTLPFTIAAAGQSAQVRWLRPLDAGLPRQLLVGQFFSGELRDQVSSDWVLFAGAALGWLLAVWGARVLRGRGAPSRGQPTESHPTAFALTLAWLLVPTAVLLLVTALVSPLYTPRYLTMSAPALAIAIAAGVRALGDLLPSRSALLRAAVPAVAGLALLALFAPTAIGQRTPDAKRGGSWLQTADILQRRIGDRPAAERARIGVVWGPDYDHPDVTTRIISVAYPAATRGAVDVTLESSAARLGTLWSLSRPLARSLDRTADLDTLYLVGAGRQLDPDEQVLADAGWRQIARYTAPQVTILRFTRG